MSIIKEFCSWPVWIQLFTIGSIAAILYSWWEALPVLLSTENDRPL